MPIEWQKSVAVVVACGAMLSAAVCVMVCDGASNGTADGASDAQPTVIDQPRSADDWVCVNGVWCIVGTDMWCEAMTGEPLSLAVDGER